MPLSPSLAGQRLGVYQVHSLLGVGGMGEVYRARDTKLQRDVAIKVLPHEVANDADGLALFEREARVLASLNILTLERSTGSKTPPRATACGCGVSCWSSS